MPTTPSTTGTLNPTAIQPHLLRRANWLWIRIALMLAAGLPLSLIGPFVLATMFWMAAIPWGYWLPWGWMFAGGMVVVIPLLYRLELRSGANYLTEAVEGGESNAAAGLWALANFTGDNTFGAVAVLVSPRASAAGFVELFLFGPRLVVGALRQWRAARAVATVDVPRASQIIVALIQAHRGLPVAQLLHPGETIANLVPTLIYLVRYDWIGISANGDKVWVLSEAKDTLQG